MRKHVIVGPDTKQTCRVRSQHSQTGGWRRQTSLWRDVLSWILKSPNGQCQLSERHWFSPSPAKWQNYLLPHWAINDAATMSMCPAVGRGGRDGGETGRRATPPSLRSSSHLSIWLCLQGATANPEEQPSFGSWYGRSRKKNRNYWSMNCCHGDSTKYGWQWEFIAAAGKDDREVVGVGRGRGRGRGIKNR